MRDLGHGRCALRVCCRSWSCEPHQPKCERVMSREIFQTGGRGGGSFVEETAADLLPRRRPGSRVA